MPDSSSEWLDSLRSKDRDVRAEACLRLAENEVGEALPELRRMTADQDPIVAVAAAYACWKLGGDDLPAGPFVAALESGDEAAVQQAVHTACAAGAAIVPALAPLLDAPRQRALLVVELLDDVGGAQAEAALRRMKNPDDAVRARVEDVLDDWEG